MTDIPIVEKLKRFAATGRAPRRTVVINGYHADVFDEAATLLKECVEALEGAADELENCAGQFRALGMTGCAQYAEAQKVKIDATLAAMTKGEE